MKKARFQLVLSMFIFGTLGPFIRNIPLSSGELALCRAVLAAALIGVYLLVSKKGIHFLEMKGELPLLLLSGAVLGINWILLFEAYKYTTVSVATLSYSVAPVLVTAVCPLIFKEKLNGRQIICFLMSTAGVVMIIGVSGFGSTGTDLKGILFGLSAAVFYASVVLLNKFIKNAAGIPRTFLQFLAAIVVLTPYVLSTSGLHLSGMGTIGTVNLLIVGLFHTGVTYCMYFSALKNLKGQEAAILSYVDPLTAVAVSVLFLNEPLSAFQAAGGALILGFAILNETWAKK